MRRKVRATADLLEKGAEFSSHLERKRGESATNIEDGGNAKLPIENIMEETQFRQPIVMQLHNVRQRAFLK